MIVMINKYNNDNSNNESKNIIINITNNGN